MSDMQYYKVLLETGTVLCDNRQVQLLQTLG